MIRFALIAFSSIFVCGAFAQSADQAVKPTKAELLKRFSDEFIEIAPGDKSRDGTIAFPK